jgi:16S rRNA (adenine(1408)-N(1))-methyltransferase
MRIVKGKRIHHLEPAAVADWLARHPHATVDLGTGDGRFVRDLAAREPRRGAIGVDLCAANLAAASHATPANALFVVADALAPPAALRRSAASVVINFPWGSLLRSLLDGSLSWSMIARPDATLEIRLNAGALAEAGWEFAVGVDRVMATLHAAGFAVGAPIPLGSAELRKSPTTWARRLAFGRDPRGCLMQSRGIGALESMGARPSLQTLSNRRGSGAI